MVAMNHAHVKAEESLKTAVVIKDTMWVLEAAKITRQCVVSRAAYQTQTEGATNLSKGKDSKKQNKKKPLKTLMEKRAAKRAKKENTGISLTVK